MTTEQSLLLRLKTLEAQRAALAYSAAHWMAEACAPYNHSMGLHTGFEALTNQVKALAQKLAAAEEAHALDADMHKIMLSSVMAERNLLIEQVKTLEADSARYRWLTEYLVSDDTQHDDAIVAAGTKEELDAVIDAAMKGTP